MKSLSGKISGQSHRRMKIIGAQNGLNLGQVVEALTLCHLATIERGDGLLNDIWKASTSDAAQVRAEMSQQQGGRA